MSQPQPAPWGGAPADPAPGGYPAPGAYPAGQPAGYPAPGAYPGQPAPGGYAAQPVAAGQPGHPAPAGYPAPAQAGPAGYAAPGQVAPGGYAQPGQAGPGQYGQPVPAPYAGQGDPGQGGYGAPPAGYPPQGMLACRFCGSVPAVQTKFRGHQGMLVLMRFLSNEGPFCRDCGLGVFRHMTSRTLIQGWYGYASFIITPFTVLMNLFRRTSVANLPAPQPNPYGPSRPPMDPGPRLLQRPMTWAGLLVPFALAALIIYAASQN
ncbi:hypothetical protein BJY16_004776 [Actinoplanes octamycinicus]|uniref:Uncharacterized protein n=1 Tax=Actinoplanes octamycinicus TaxID=135948 RepID=A0A7W7M8W8_9ACTN|nr:toxin-antitoxin system, toxin component [Actinoplanes octamycinicus]MBB4741317.1 hypothetical protein [Actinoplanes octamycinicus]GIE62883.1 hypothetical protein Aoc01nite_82850 [Actinoplanes octamycinicus]